MGLFDYLGRQNSTGLTNGQAFGVLAGALSGNDAIANFSLQNAARTQDNFRLQQEEERKRREQGQRLAARQQELNSLADQLGLQGADRGRFMFEPEKFLDRNHAFALQDDKQDHAFDLEGRKHQHALGMAGVSHNNALALQDDRQAFDVEQSALARAGDEKNRERQRFGDATDLRKEFTKVTDDFRDIQNSLNTINTVAGERTAAGDLALVVAFTKLQDPGSVAREGEVALTQSAAPLFSTAKNWVARLEKGNTFLPDDVRAQLVDTANKIGAGYGASYKTRIGEYQFLAERGNIDPRLVLTGINDPTVPAPAASPPSPQNTAEPFPGFGLLSPEEQQRYRELSGL